MNPLFKFSRRFFTQAGGPVRYEMNNKIGILTINNAAKRNALSLNVLEAFKAQLESIEKSSGAEKPVVLILTSEGSVFSSGHDLKELQSFTKEKQNYTFDLLGKIMTKMQEIPQIVIGEIQGLATAAGCQIACTCDLTVGSSKSHYATPGIKVGLFCTTPSVALGRIVSNKRAMQMLVTGQPIDAKTAYNWGILNEIVDVESEGNDFDKERKKLREATLKLANEITCYSGETLGFGKQAFYKQVAMKETSNAYNFACNAMTENLHFEDTQEGISAFLQKRKPNFKH